MAKFPERPGAVRLPGSSFQILFPLFICEHMRGPGSKPSLLFQLVIPATAVFVITILSLIAIVFSDPRAPIAQWLDKNGNRLLIVEFVVVIILSFIAMAVDRIQILKQLKQTNPNATDSSATNDETSSSGE